MRAILVLLALSLAAPMAFARPKPLLTGQSAGADSTSTASTNPAGITRFDSTNMRLDIYYIDTDSTWEQEFGNTGFRTRTTTESDLTVPNGSIVVPISEDWYFGFSMLAYSVSDDYGEDWVGRYVIEEYDLVFVSAYPSIAYKVTDKWSVAASLAGTYTSFTQESSVPNLPEPGNPNPGDGDLEIDADGYTVGFGFSTLYEFTDRTRIGFNYQSELDPDLDGDVDFDNLTAPTEAILDAANLLDASIDVDTRSPQRANVGIYHEFENHHAITADINWIDWSSFQLAEIYVNGGQLNESDFDYDDIWAYSAGYSYPVGNKWTVAVAGIYVPDMVDDDNRQLSLRLDEIWGVGAGFEWKVSPKLRFDATINYIQIDDAPIVTDDIDTIGGPIRGEFTDRGFWLLQFGVEFGTGAKSGV
jgi:long-chain fatty acid transport protein